MWLEIFVLFHFFFYIGLNCHINYSMLYEYICIYMFKYIYIYIFERSSTIKIRVGQVDQRLVEFAGYITLAGIHQ